MFDLFKLPQKVKEMDSAVSQSFAKVKEDTEHLQQWVSYLNHQNQQLQEQNAALRRLTDEQKLALNELKVTVQHLPKTPSEIRSLVESHFDWKPVLERVRRIEQKIELLELQREHQRAFTRPLHHEAPSVSRSQPAPQPVHVEKPAPKPAPAIREKLMRKLARNSKDYIKNLILGLVHKYSKIAAMQLREIVVEEQGLCSKSSFYRILEEMEKDGTLNKVSSGKQAVYVATAQH